MYTVWKINNLQNFRKHLNNNYHNWNLGQIFLNHDKHDHELCMTSGRYTSLGLCDSCVDPNITAVYWLSGTRLCLCIHDYWILIFNSLLHIDSYHTSFGITIISTQIASCNFTLNCILKNIILHNRWPMWLGLYSRNNRSIVQFNKPTHMKLYAWTILTIYSSVNSVLTIFSYYYKPAAVETIGLYCTGLY